MAPHPPTPPLERLQVTDGLLLTADRWRVAHQYHRQRQDLHFQALYQPGVVTGLGVCPTAAPAQVVAPYRDGRWLQVQPGWAIDGQGNPIVVPKPVDYRIAATPSAEPIQVYLVLSFVDPDQLDGAAGTHVVQETFRLEERVSPPAASDLELCRIWLLPGDEALRSPADGFAPAANELDLRHRPQVQLRPQSELQMGYVTRAAQPDPVIEESLAGLAAALPGLYPALRGKAEIGHLMLGQLAAQGDLLQSCDLLQITWEDSQRLQSADLEPLQAHQAGGGLLLVEVPATATFCEAQFQRWATVATALSGLDAAPQSRSRYTELTTEYAELERSLALAVSQAIAPLVAPVENAIASEHWPQSGIIDAQHPLRTAPFHFGLLPTLQRQPLALFAWGGVVVAVGDLVSAWGGDYVRFLPRDTLRSTQELGINLLHFAWQRRRWAMGLAQPPEPPPPAPSLGSIYDRLKF